MLSMAGGVINYARLCRYTTSQLAQLIGNKIMSHSHKVSLFDEVVVLTPLPPLLLLLLLLLLFLLLMKTTADIVVVVSAGARAIMMEMYKYCRRN